MNIYQIREQVRQRTNLTMDKHELKEFTDYCLNRQDVLDDYIDQFFSDMYENYRCDRYVLDGEYEG